MRDEEREREKVSSEHVCRCVLKRERERIKRCLYFPYLPTDMFMLIPNDKFPLKMDVLLRQKQQRLIPVSLNVNNCWCHNFCRYTCYYDCYSSYLYYINLLLLVSISLIVSSSLSSSSIIIIFITIYVIIINAIFNTITNAAVDNITSCILNIGIVLLTILVVTLMHCQPVPLSLLPSPLSSLTRVFILWSHPPPLINST